MQSPAISRDVHTITGRNRVLLSSWMYIPSQAGTRSCFHPGCSYYNRQEQDPPINRDVHIITGRNRARLSAGTLNLARKKYSL